MTMKCDHKSALDELQRLAKQIQITLDGLSMDRSLRKLTIQTAGVLVQWAIRAVEEEIARTRTTGSNAR